MSGLDVILTIIAILVLLTVLSIVVLSLVWLERKFLARIQMRMGPMRVGPHGLLQPVADAVKLMTKEDILPGWVDKVLYWVAPLVVFVPSFISVDTKADKPSAQESSGRSNRPIPCGFCRRLSP